MYFIPWEAGSRPVAVKCYQMVNSLCHLLPHPPHPIPVQLWLLSNISKVEIRTLKEILNTFPSQNEGHFATEQAESWKNPLAQEQYNLILVGPKMGEWRWIPENTNSKSSWANSTTIIGKVIRSACQDFSCVLGTKASAFGRCVFHGLSSTWIPKHEYLCAIFDSFQDGGEVWPILWAMLPALCHDPVPWNNF